MADEGPLTGKRPLLQRGIRASKTRSIAALWSKSLLNALLFFAIFMVALPSAAHWLLPLAVPVPQAPRAAFAVLLLLVGVAGWVWGLDVFSRRGRGTPFPLDAPRHLATEGPFARLRNPIMAAELLVIWGAAAYFGSVGVLVYAAAMTALAHWLVLHVEEPELRSRFGAQYDAYCARVPRWLPAFGAERPPAA